VIHTFEPEEGMMRFPETQSPMFVLEIMSGPLDGKTWTFESEIVIGRDDACITIDRYVSRRHARLFVDGERLRVADLQSRNGTRIGGQAVVEDAPLEVGATFQIGHTLLRVTKV